MTNAFRASVLVAGIALGHPGCGGAHEAPLPPNFDVVTCKPPPRADDCKPRDCGGNSPIVNEFPINGLSKDGRGECNPSGVQLLPQSLQGGGCGSGADLMMSSSGRGLIGKRNGKVACEGTKLAGATFMVRSHAATLIFTISNVRKFEAFNGTSWDVHEGYRIESSGETACDPAAARRIRHQLGMVTKAGSASESVLAAAGYAFGIDDDLVIAVGGSLYDYNGQLLDDTHEHWFSLACVGDALAKRTFYKVFLPEDEITSATSLSMLTANYCGKAYTARGLKIEWMIPDLRLPLEARWSSGKATCIETPRLSTLKVNGAPIELSTLPANLQPKDCVGKVCTREEWAKALAAECGIGTCAESSSSFQFESFIHDRENSNLVRLERSESPP